METIFFCMIGSLLVCICSSKHTPSPSKKCHQQFNTWTGNRPCPGAARRTQCASPHRHTWSLVAIHACPRYTVAVADARFCSCMIKYIHVYMPIQRSHGSFWNSINANVWYKSLMLTNLMSQALITLYCWKIKYPSFHYQKNLLSVTCDCNTRWAQRLRSNFASPWHHEK